MFTTSTIKQPSGPVLTWSTVLWSFLEENWRVQVEITASTLFLTSQRPSCSAWWPSYLRALLMAQSPPPHCSPPSPSPPPSTTTYYSPLTPSECGLCPLLLAWQESERYSFIYTTEQERQCVAANLPWAQKLAPDKPLPFFFCTRRGIEPAMLSAPRRRFKWRQFLL